MKDASNTRRSMGKFGIFAAAAIILPLTATIVPAVTAQDETVTEIAKPHIIKKQVKIIKISKDGKDVHVIGDAGDGKEVTKIERDGKTFIFRTDKKLSEEEAEKMIERAEESRAKAEEAWGEAEEARGHADSERVAADHARAAAEHGHAEAIRVMHGTNFASYVPEIDITEITKNCKDGEPATTDVSGFDGQNKSRIKIVMCGKGQVKLARIEAIKGLREARGEIADDKDIPQNIRKEVLEKLEEQIRKLESETDKAG